MKRRSLSANAKFHAICREIAEKATFGGEQLSEQDWKVLLISGHAAEVDKQGIGRIVKGLANEYVQLRERSRYMDPSRMNSLIEYAYAIGSQRGVKFSAPERYEACHQ